MGEIKNMLVDSHCHLNRLNLEKYNGDLSLLIEETKRAGISHLLCVGIDLANAKADIDLAHRFENVFASVGIHPSEKLETEPTAEEIIALANDPKVVAVGETGLDYYYNDTGLERMRERFRHHLRIGKKLNKPVIIHSRQAHKDTINIMREENAADVGGVMHCFTESWEMAKEAMDLNFYISFSGIITFHNAKNVVEVAKKVPLDRMLIETDAPYLTPVPFRGKPNEPQYVRYVAEKIADIKNISFEKVGEITTSNFFNFIKLKI